jgi:hypothetical protein
MKQKLLLVVVGLVAVGLTVFGASVAFRKDVSAAPEGFASPINVGCYIAAPNQCRIHVDPFTININDGAGARLQQFTLYANGSPIYDFRTDVSNPPGVDYSPSLVAQDFAATCGTTYVVNMIAKDTTDANPLNYGQTTAFTCPTTVP